MQTPREICMKLLASTEKNASYSNIALDRLLVKYHDLRDVDRRFITALYYGVIERRLTLDAVIKKYSSRPSNKLSDAVRQILRMGLYQLLYMDSVPDSAAVNESVKLAGGNKNPAVPGFVNALLRGFIRDGKVLPKTGDKLTDLSVEYSCPEWIIKMWLEDYGESTALSMLRSSVGRPPVTVRFNLIRHSREDIIHALELDGVSCVISDKIEGCAELFNCGSVENLEAYRLGMIHVQDISCQICAMELGAKPGETVLDMCSAPGGKAFTIAEMMNDCGRVLAYDLHQNRVRLIADGAKRLGLSSVEAGVNNAKQFNEDIPTADRVLCDVPCSGLGVIRRKPEIKYSDRAAIGGLPGVQYDILSMSASYVKDGGTLIYSTCTLNRAENDLIAKRFLEAHPEFEPVKLDNFPDYKVSLIPDDFGGDGFFISKFRRKE